MHLAWPCESLSRRTHATDELIQCKIWFRIHSPFRLISSTKEGSPLKNTQANKKLINHELIKNRNLKDRSEIIFLPFQPHGIFPIWQSYSNTRGYRISKRIDDRIRLRYNKSYVIDRGKGATTKRNRPQVRAVRCRKQSLGCKDRWEHDISAPKGLAKLGNIVAETLLRMQMFLSLAAR